MGNKVVEDSMKLVCRNLEKVILRQLPRILTQVCRDESNPAYGSFDRNWWHYRMRDFSSIILQQGGYAVWEARNLFNSVFLSETSAKSIAEGTCKFWNQRAVKHGSFEEYYPWEQGYPPLAFSTLAIAKMVCAGVVPKESIWDGLKIAAHQLSVRFEAQAANQQVAGLAALAQIRKIAPELVSLEDYEKQRDKTLALQTSEGWFWEYDGPDLGYLSVTIDCLWDLLDVTGEEIYRDVAKRALDFLHTTICYAKRGLGMFNARNTDYVVPYGIARFYSEGNEEDQNKAASLLETLYSTIDLEFHFFDAIDDRYWCHYIGHSVVRAVQLLQKKSHVGSKISQRFSKEIYYPICGYLFRMMPCGGIATVALKKGGIVRLSKNEMSSLDFGWVVDVGKKQFVSHWWSQNWDVQRDENHWTIIGPLAAHKEPESKPIMHIALRMLSFCFGKKLISLLKKVMIFKKPKSPYNLKRIISFEDDAIVIQDEISGIMGGEQIHSAKRASKRHVASADSFHPEDFQLCELNTVERECRTTDNLFVATTRLRLGSIDE